MNFRSTVDDTHVYSAEPALYNENLHAPSAPPISEDVLKGIKHVLF
jgi:hypothetical protein